MSYRRVSGPIKTGAILLVCLSIPIVFFPVGVPNGNMARRSSCLSNVRQLTLGIAQYAEDYDQTLPPASQWASASAPYVQSERTLHCISATTPFSYAFNRPLGAYVEEEVDDKASTILLFEADASERDAAGGRENLTKQDRHSKALSYGLLDGHAKLLSAHNSGSFLHWKPLLSHRASSAMPTSGNPLRFPIGTLLVDRSVTSGETTWLWATSGALYNRRTGTHFNFPNDAGVPEAIMRSPDGKQLILRRTYDTFVLNAATLHLTRHLETRHVWWQDGRYAWIDDEHDDTRLLSPGRKAVLLRQDLEVYAMQDGGHYFLCAKKLSRGTRSHGFMPTYRLQIWQHTSWGTFRWRRNLGDFEFDPGSTGAPTTLATLNGRLVVFGLPRGGAIGDYLASARDRRLTAPRTDAQGRFLAPLQTPLLTDTAILGLAEAIERPDDSLLPTPPDPVKYLYRLTDAGWELKPVPADTQFVWYDPQQHALQLGRESQSGVSLQSFVSH